VRQHAVALTDLLDRDLARRCCHEVTGREALGRGQQDVRARVAARVSGGDVGLVVAGIGEVRLVHVDRHVPVVGRHDDLDALDFLGPERGSARSAEQIGAGEHQALAF
jgi:hypothetical protein